MAFPFIVLRVRQSPEDVPSRDLLHAQDRQGGIRLFITITSASRQALRACTGLVDASVS